MVTLNQQQLSAWKTVIPDLGLRHQEILTVMLELDGNATVGEISSKLNKQLHQISGRLSELCQRKFISDSGKTRVNPSTLRHMTVWMLNTDRVEEWLLSRSERISR